MGYLLRKLCFTIALGAAVHAAAHPTDGDTAQFVTTRLAVTGAVQHALNLSVADLRQLPAQKLGELPLLRQGGANAGQLANLKGVRLRDLLEQAAVVSRDHNDVKKMVVIATASDGYKVVFSWSELFNSPVGEGVLVYFEKDGQPLGDDEGRIAMVSSKDIRSGPRHVKWLQSIEVKKIAE
ncbi:molybdopterin-dependent oxidoreductase [Duganella sp. HH101]|uniref:molybdopterin-dependent oxidoreductase n=1 Tax=Duganella sp. HH101 TaxID=1781066 RepID=UPI000874B09C|nr:molybdopterin-dependent oxidoreductase [Duganella sp. HH101]OEZ96823.1 oxidoreductase molybdopterin binding domain protein [Duganella sp. HH101]